MVCDGGYERAFDRMVADGLISTRRLTKDPNIVDELVSRRAAALFDQF